MTDPEGRGAGPPFKWLPPGMLLGGSLILVLVYLAWLNWPPTAAWIPVGLMLLVAAGVADLLLRFPGPKTAALEVPHRKLLLIYAIGGFGIAASGMMLAVLWKDGVAGLGLARHWLAVVLLGLVGAAGGIGLASRHQPKPPESVPSSTPARRPNGAVERTIWWLLVAVGVGAIGQVLWAAGQGLASFGEQFWLLLGVNMLISGAAAILGGVLGFLFGIPRTALPSGELAIGTTTEKTSTAARLVANTNLERVSDWLTTLLIGATLTQLVNIPGALWDVAGRLSDFGTSVPQVGESYRTVVVALIVYFFLTGFLGLYLITRLYLTEAFQDVLERLQVLAPTSGPPALEDVLRRAGEALAAPKPDPDHALQVLDEIKGNAAAWQSRRLQALRARALGRRWLLERQSNSSRARLDATQDEALQALKAAAEGDASIQEELRGYLRQGGDLEVFLDDDATRKLLGVHD